MEPCTYPVGVLACFRVGIFPLRTEEREWRAQHIASKHGQDVGQVFLYPDTYQTHGLTTCLLVKNRGYLIFCCFVRVK